MHDAGIPLLAALATAAELTGNAVLARNLLDAREGVARATLCAALPAKHALPRVRGAALRAGESTGQSRPAAPAVEDYAQPGARSGSPRRSPSSSHCCSPRSRQSSA